jgi:putative transposase
MNYRKSSHSLYGLQYHVVFCTKYRYRVLSAGIADRCRELIREICLASYVDILGGNISPDHIHILISVPPHVSVSKIVQYIKGKSSRKLQQEFGELRKRYWGQHLWARGYGALNTSDVQKYIEQQEEHHRTDNFKVSEF